VGESGRGWKRWKRVGEGGREWERRVGKWVVLRVVP
jgi:hypothetical protein